MLSPRTRRSPKTAMLWPWTEVVALCQNLFRQRLCQTASQGGPVKEGLVFPQVQMKEGQGKADAWAAASRTAVLRISL